MPALNIKNDRAYTLVKELADLRGASMTSVVIEAVEKELERERGTAPPADLAARLIELSGRTAPLWKEPWKSTPHGDLLYDGHGLPK